MRNALTAALYHVLNGNPGAASRLTELLKSSIVRWPGVSLIRIYDKQPNGSKRQYVIRITEERAGVGISNNNRRGYSNATIRERGPVRKGKVKARRKL